MTRSVKNALKAVAVLTCITAVCVCVLALCNMFFPKYTPTLDRSTCRLINGLYPTGVADDVAFSEGYIVMLSEDEYGVALDSYNKTNRSDKARILAVYGMPKTDGFPFVIESSSDGRDGEVVILTAYYGGAAYAATVKKQSDGYWSKLPSDIFAGVAGTTGSVDLAGSEELAHTGATISLNAVSRAVSSSNKFAGKYSGAIQAALGERAQTGGGA